MDLDPQLEAFFGQCRLGFGVTGSCGTGFRNLYRVTFARYPADDSGKQGDRDLLQSKQLQLQVRSVYYGINLCWDTALTRKTDCGSCVNDFLVRQVNH